MHEPDVAPRRKKSIWLHFERSREMLTGNGLPLAASNSNMGSDDH